MLVDGTIRVGTMFPPQGEGQEPPPPLDARARQDVDRDNPNEVSEGTMNNSPQKGKESKTENRNSASSSTCKPVATKKPQVFFPSERINARIQYMRDHALISKFVGIWPTKRALRAWISAVWHPKGDISLHLGLKGFFTTVFNCLEDRTRILEGGPYFFNSAGLFLKGWVERFNPDKEDLSSAPVWIRLYSLPWEYWEETSLQEIGNAIGQFVRVAEETRLCKHTSYARICVYIDLKQPLPDTVSFFHEDSEWVQVIDYEQVPFRCRKCHDIGHLYRDCPLNKTPSMPDKSNNHSTDGFTKVVNKRRGNKKATNNPKANPSNKATSSNRFEVLNKTYERGSDEEQEKDEAVQQQQPGETSMQGGKKIIHQEHLKEPNKNMSKQSEKMDMEYSQPSGKALTETEDFLQSPQVMDEDLEPLDFGELDILGLEQACRTRNFEKIREEQVDNLVAVLSKAQKKYSLGVQIGSPWDGKFITKDSKKRGRKTTLERTIKIGEILVESGRYAKLTKYFTANPHPSQ